MLGDIIYEAIEQELHNLEIVQERLQKKNEDRSEFARGWMAALANTRKAVKKLLVFEPE